MASDSTPFIPAKLDDADLSPHEFRVFCHVSRRGECTASVGKMSDDTGVSKPTLRDALKTLRAASMIEKEPRPGTTNIHRVLPTEEWDLNALKGDENDTESGEDPSQDFGDPKKLPLQKVRDHPSQIFGDHPSQDFGGASKGYPLEGNPLEGAKEVSAADAPLPSYLLEVVDRISWQAEPLPDDHPARWEYQPGDWRWKAGKYLLDGLRERDVLHSGIDDSRPDGEIAAEWGDTMRLLHEQDGYHRKVISGTLWWLFNTDNWWIKNAIQSGSNGALRDRSGGGDNAHKFDKLVQKARRYYEQQQEQRIDPEEIHDGWGGDGESGPSPPRPAGNAVATGDEVDEHGFQW